MKNYPLNKIILFFLLLGLSRFSWAACTQTLSSGANLATAIASAPAGSTICLNTGTYAEASLSGISKTSDVTIQSASGRGASVSFVIRSSNHLKFQNLTITKMDMQNNSVFNTNISVLNNTFKGQMLVNGSGKAGVDVNILVDGNTFDGINICSGCLTGRLQLWGITGVRITNNHFGGGGTADGILWGGYGGQVGPGNVFEGILQSAAGSTGAHIDALQLNGAGPGFSGNVENASIVGNYFVNDSTFIMAPDGSSNITVNDNVFDGRSIDYAYKIQFGSTSNSVFEHNTLIGTGAAFDSKLIYAASYNVTVKNNILTSYNFKTIGGNGCTNCTFTRNLFGPSATQNGTNNLTGTPTYLGGSSPSTWAGWQLASTSIGYRSALDGKDLGTTFYGTGSISSNGGVTIASPTNLRVQ